jgi:hypothetical protein
VIEDGTNFGSGEVQTGSNAVSHIGKMELWNRTFVTQGFVGIGATPLGTVGQLVFGHQPLSHVEVNCAAARPFCFSATSMSINGDSVRAKANTTYMVDQLYAYGATFRGGKFVGTYAGHSDREHIYGSPMIHLTSVDLPRDFDTLWVSQRSHEMFKVPFDSGSEKCLLLGLPASGHDEIEVRRLMGDSSEGKLCSATPGKFDMGNDEAVFDNVLLCSESKTRGGLSPGGKTRVLIAVIVVVPVAAFLVWWFVFRVRKAGGSYVPAESPSKAAAYTVSFSWIKDHSLHFRPGRKSSGGAGGRGDEWHRDGIPNSGSAGGGATMRPSGARVRASGSSPLPTMF